MLGYDDYVASEGQGFAGGIIVAWKKDYIQVDVIVKKFQFIHMKVNYTGGRWWYFIAIYASPNESNRSNLWNDLKVIAGNMTEAWIIAGDFNDIMSEDEKRGGVRASIRRCSKFRERVEACNLIDMGAAGPKFTWRGPLYHGGQRIFERLDRALCNTRWRLDFPDGFVKVLPRLDFSDHHPILISPREAPHPVAPRQFKFESAWLGEANYQDMLKTCWKRRDSIANNLHSVEREIKIWKYQHLDQVLHIKKELMARIAGVQRRIQGGVSNEGLRNLEHRLQSELSDILKKEELMWFQRSRAKWLRDGDRNTRYYHLKTVKRRRQNNILMLKDEQGQWIDKEDQLQDLANEFYKKLFTDTQISREWFQTEITYPDLDTEMLNTLAAPISNEEIK
ncbi:hypothetical protein P8452_48843 [Trifolium repens]|nr:hypothetical protein P8452_48843 [Trifolium repens]